eukprot:NODE_823_length_3913_cov_0.131096.p2 type:complete len:165 gc:universal NODE_823_length_3913_cov_0.131096:153-647(+)
MASFCTQISHSEEGCTLTLLTKRNGENLRIQRTSKSLPTIEKFKRIHDRKIPKFGDYKSFALKESDNIVLKLSLDAKVIEKAEIEQYDTKIKNVGAIECRHCGGEHLSMRCPNKDLQKILRPESNKSQATATSSSGPSVYVPPSRRNLDPNDTSTSMLRIFFLI